MHDLSASRPTFRRPVSGAGLLTLGGLAAAFGLASCCAVPMLLATLGLGTAWLGVLAVMAAPHRGALTLIGGSCLLGGAVLLWRQQRAAATCGPGGACQPSWVRALTLAGLLIGVALLWAGYVFV